MDPRMDVEKLGIDDDGGDDDGSRDWMVNVANEERIEGAEGTGKGDRPDHMHHHCSLLLDTMFRTDKERVYISRPILVPVVIH